MNVRICFDGIRVGLKLFRIIVHYRLRVPREFKLKRRDILRLAALTTAAAARPTFADALVSGPILDAHIHLFDPTRPGGIPWPLKENTTLYRPALPERYARVSATFGVIGAIAIEASPLASDNEWLLGVAGKNPLIVGIIGDLVPGSAAYLSQLEHLQKDPLFLGIRYGNLWARNLDEDLNKPGFVDGLRALSQAGLVFETANPDAQLIQGVLRISSLVPGLRIVVDHLPNATVAKDKNSQTAFCCRPERTCQGP